MIKLSLKKNLLYLLAFCISYYARKILSIIIDKAFKFNDPYIFLYMMAFGEIIGGSAIYIYQMNYRRKKKDIKYFGIKIIQNKQYINAGGSLKKILLLFLASFFDIYEFIIISFYVPKIGKFSPTLDLRLGCITTISSALICIYAFRFKNGKHHNFSLISLGICLFLTVILEIIFKGNDIPFGIFMLAVFLVFYYLISITFTDCIERYLAYYYFLNPFLILMIEGVFGLIMAILYSIKSDPLKELFNQYDVNGLGKFILLIFLLILYLILSAVLNAYKIYVNVIYSPMARSITDYLMNPFFNIYYFFAENDFQQNFAYFFICEIISILIDFFCFVFNEYITLYCFGLDHDTSDTIVKRAMEREMHPANYDIDIDEEEYIFNNESGDKDNNEKN